MKRIKKQIISIEKVNLRKFYNKRDIDKDKNCYKRKNFKLY